MYRLVSLKYLSTILWHIYIAARRIHCYYLKKGIAYMTGQNAVFDVFVKSPTFSLSGVT